MLCLSLNGETIKDNLNMYFENIDLLDSVELRVDFLKHVDLEEIAEFLEKCRHPVILTCRREKDGGRYSNGEKSRLALLKKLLKLGFDYVDLEEDVKKGEIDTVAKDMSTRIIRSVHIFDEFPADLFARIQKTAANGEIPKFAIMLHSIKELHTIFNVKHELRSIKEKIILGMGSFGVPSRILYKLTGSFLTYCSPRGSEIAEGQLPLNTMKNLYSADEVDERTIIYGIIGNPVMHSASPEIHNPALKELKLNAVYVPFQVKNIRDFFIFAEKLGIRGFSVTVPHKQAVLPYLGKISREVKLIGSCNTVVKEKQLWKGINTDYYGFLKPIYNLLESNRIKKGLIIGAGGAARSVAWALRNHGCSIIIANRTVEKAKYLAAETGAKWASIDEIKKFTSIDLIVQTTNVGMYPEIDNDPIENYSFTGNEILYDLIYTPAKTKLMLRAEKAGAELISGKEMLISQGIYQFEAFTGHDFPYPGDTVIF
ncbi:MAG: shikimate dehydrogenase [Spirochaetia bacterium]|nr:shikimate dehydrogenase [Spirochaetia bacterium]